MAAAASHQNIFENSNRKPSVFLNELYFSDASSDSDSDDEAEYKNNNKITNTEADNNNPPDHDHDKNDHHHESTVDGDDCIIEKTNTPLQNSWNYYYHLPNDKNWNLDSYYFISDNMNSLETLIGINEMVTDNIIKNCMLFVMKTGISPMWEDKQNRNGGCFSYKVVNKVVCQVWRKLIYLLCGNCLTMDPKHNEMINGITISPKKGFCIVKIWMKTCKYQDPSIIVNVDGLIKNGCLFKAHSPEF